MSKEYTEKYMPGPKMRALTEAQQNFVRNLFLMPDNIKDAYMAAYPACTPGTARTNGWKLAHNQRIKEAIREEGESRTNTLVPQALKTLADSAADPKDKDKVTAAKHVLALAGFVPHQVIEVRRDDPAAKIKAITGMLAQLSALGMTIDLPTLIPRNLMKLADPVDFETIIEQEDDWIGA